MNMVDVHREMKQSPKSAGVLQRNLRPWLDLTSLVGHNVEQVNINSNNFPFPYRFNGTKQSFQEISLNLCCFCHSNRPFNYK